MNDAPSVIATAAQAGTQESWPRARLVRPDLAIHLFEREQVSAFFAVARLGSPMLVGVAVAPRSAAVAMSAWRRLSTPSCAQKGSCLSRAFSLQMRILTGAEAAQISAVILPPASPRRPPLESQPPSGALKRQIASSRCPKEGADGAPPISA